MMPARKVQTALVTGASGAFGSELSTRLRAGGTRVAGLDLTACDGVRGCDVRDPESVRSATAEAVAELGGRLDAVVHCAGIGPALDAGAEPTDAVTEVLEVNLVGAWRVTAAALPALLAEPGRGRVVVVSSLLSLVNVPFAGAYSVSKRGVVAWADALRLEYGGRLAVTSVLPGYVDTPIHARSRAAGVALDGLVPAETVDDVAGTITRVLAADRPPRETATTRGGQVVRLLARHAPGLVDRAVLSRARRHVLTGGFPDSTLAAAWRERLVTR